MGSFGFTAFENDTALDWWGSVLTPLLAKEAVVQRGRCVP